MDKLTGILDTLLAWVDEVPPVKQPMRFGNKAFRTWHAKVAEVRDPTYQVVRAHTRCRHRRLHWA